MYELNEKEFWHLCDLGGNLPVPLRYDDLSVSFVYGRDFGLIHCTPGSHQRIMAFLWCLLNKLDWRQETPARNVELADLFMQQAPGAAVRSSVRWEIQCRPEGLTPFELLNLSPRVAYNFN